MRKLKRVRRQQRRVAVGAQCATVDDVLLWLSIDVGLGALAAVSAVLSDISAAKKCRPNVVGASQADFCRMDEDVERISRLNLPMFHSLHQRNKISPLVHR